MTRIPLEEGAPDVAASTPDLTSHYFIHRALRDGAACLADAVRRAGPGTGRERIQALCRWYAGFVRELQMHHRIEDTVHFPALSERVPAIAGHEGRLDAEHAQLVRSMARVHTALAQLDAAPVDLAAHAEAVVATAELSSLLDVHLDHEDVDVLPLFVRHFSAEEYLVLEERARRAGSLRTMAFTVPFVAEASSPTELAELLESAPIIVRVVLLATRSRYRRLVRTAFG
ncbi:MAG: hemerythrin domain-containing protein [Microthrixaceae bacterium]